MSSLYEYFGCENKEELYKKVKQDDKSVRSLVDFIDYSKSSIENTNIPITSPDSFVEFVNPIKKPSKDEAVLVFVNTKNRPEHVSRINISNEQDLKMALKESLFAGSESLFVMYDSHIDSYERDKLENYFKRVRIGVMDSFDYNGEDNWIRSKQEGIRIPIDTTSQTVAEIQIEQSYAYGSRELSQLKEYDEFVSFFAEQEIIGLNFIDDNERIKESLKVGYQDDWQESLGLITCDSFDQVISVKKLFKGATSSAPIDMKVIAKEILSRNDVANISIFHNHPSGESEPSDADLDVTGALYDLCENLDVELLDHFIVGKESVYSFAKSEDEIVSYNQKYQEEIRKQGVNKKNRQIELEF